MRRHTIDLDGPTVYADFGGPADGAPTVLVHGLGSSHVSWASLAPLLAARRRVVALDLVGFGGSAPEGRGCGVEDNRVLLSRFLTSVVDGPVTLVGSSMGGAIAALVAHASPSLVEQLVLLGPAVPVTPTLGALRDLDLRGAALVGANALPGLAGGVLRARRLHVDPARSTDGLLSIVCADPSRVDPAVRDLLVESAAARRGLPWADAGLIEGARSVLRLTPLEAGRYRRALEGLEVPTLVLHGTDDALVPVAAARRVAERSPAMAFEAMPGVGHAPQLEVPTLVAGRIAAHAARVADAA